MKKMPSILITDEMFIEATRLIGEVKVNRTQSGPQDTITGVLGEFAFCEWFLGDWRKHSVTTTRGRSDLADRIELKASSYPMSPRLNLVVREDYAGKRSPEAYVQMILDVPADSKKVSAGVNCFITGWTTHDRALEVEPDHMPQKDGGMTEYRSHLVPIHRLNDISDFPFDPDEIEQQMSNLKSKFEKEEKKRDLQKMMARLGGWGGRQTKKKARLPTPAASDRSPEPF